MTHLPDPDTLDEAHGKRTRISITLELDAHSLLMAEPLHAHVVLSRAAYKLADELSNNAVTLLIGSALEATCRQDKDSAAMALGAAVELLRQITESQLQGVIS